MGRGSSRSPPYTRHARDADPILDNAHLRSIVETVPDAMIIIDEHGVILSFSRTAEKMFGYSPAEVIGENISMLMPSPDRERHDGYIARYLATGEKRIIGIGRAINARRRDGTTFPADLSVGETRIEGRPIFTGFLHDLSERTETRHKLHVLQAELAHVARVSQMGTLATAIAHELNQPLAAINNYIETASAILAEDERPDHADIREALSCCSEEVTRAGQIIRRLREFITYGETEKARAKLRQVIEESIALALAERPGTSVAVSMQTDDDADDILADRIQIQQVLVNLIRNAIESMNDTESRLINISTSALDDDWVEIVVADNGPGLNPRIAQRLFQPFETTKENGMGLGLSICHTIVEGHGGRIWADRSVFGGTAFHLTLQRLESVSEPRS